MSIKDLVLNILQKSVHSKCCHSLLNSTLVKDKCLLLELSQRTSINILEKEQINGLSASYKSHVEVGNTLGPRSYVNNKMYSQGCDDSIYRSNFGICKNLTMIAVYFSKMKGLQVMQNADDFIYDKSVQLKLHKQYLKVVSPKKQQKKQEIIKEYELEKSHNEERHSYKRTFDKERNKIPKRKAMRNQVDKVRDQSPKRKSMRNKIDKVRNENPHRIAQQNQIDKVS